MIKPKYRQLRGRGASFGRMAEKEPPIEEFKKQLEDCKKQGTEYLLGWQRSRADFLNYKKEEMERIGELLKYANEEFILKILPILDNFDLAEKKLPENLKNDENTKGILQIKTQLRDFLKNQGVEELEGVGQKFDPTIHEVVEEVKKVNAESGTVIEVVQKGYKINGRLLRPVKVRVAK